jgi:hypothetical protein
MMTFILTNILTAVGLGVLTLIALVVGLIQQFFG